MELNEAEIQVLAQIRGAGFDSEPINRESLEDRGSRYWIYREDWKDAFSSLADKGLIEGEDKAYRLTDDGYPPANELANAHKFALDRFTAELLPVIDSFEAAVQTAREHSGEQDDAPDAPDASDESVVAIAQGVELSLKLLFDVMERAGVKIVDPVGEPFDPTLHEAMGMVESPDAEPGSVIHVVQKGYTLNDRLVRAAMVMVAKAAAEEPSKEG